MCVLVVFVVLYTRILSYLLYSLHGIPRTILKSLLRCFIAFERLKGVFTTNRVPTLGVFGKLVFGSFWEVFRRWNSMYLDVEVECLVAFGSPG